MREIHRSAYFVLSVDDQLRLVRRARTEEGFPSVSIAEASYDAMLEAFARESIHRPSHSLLADVRRAPARNDPAFEQTVERYYARLYGGFRRAATLVKTQAGRLQITRLSRAHGMD